MEREGGERRTGWKKRQSELERTKVETGFFQNRKKHPGAGSRGRRRMRARDTERGRETERD